MLGTTRFLSERDGKRSLTARDVLKQLFDDNSGFSESDSGGGDGLIFKRFIFGTRLVLG